MLDIKLIRDNPRLFDIGMRRRGLTMAATKILELDKKWRLIQAEVEGLQAERNRLSNEIGRWRPQVAEKSIVQFVIQQTQDADKAGLIAKLKQNKEKQAFLEAEATRLREAVDAELAPLPNLPADDVPDGKDAADNKLLREVGAKPKLAFKPKDHAALGEALGGMDFTRAAKISGARFVVLSGGIARLARALGQFMLDLHTREFGYTEIVPPLLVRDAAVFGTGQLPKFADDLFRTTTGLWLVPTAEVSLTNLVREDIVDEEKLPLRYTALTPCFRSEAGAAGKDTRGMIRQHQFDKVELVSIAHPDKSADEHERMTSCAEEVLKRLGLAYRVMLLCTGDMGASARKTYDIEVWLPGENGGAGAYREISSCSNCGDYQARRMDARCKPKGGKGTRFVHTLNGSGLAVGRALIAVMENYQRADGSIAVPEALRSYVGGTEVIAGGV